METVEMLELGAKLGSMAQFLERKFTEGFMPKTPSGPGRRDKLYPASSIPSNVMIRSHGSPQIIRI